MVTSLLSAHLEQISLCAASISDLEFPPPKQFTNALLAPHEITALIRDTEIHERALFSIAPPPVSSKSDSNQFPSSPRSRQSVAPHATRQPKRNTAVAAVLGRELYRKVREADASVAQSGGYGNRTRAKGEVDVEVLLQGATRLCEVYPIPGAREEIEKARRRYEQLSANIAHYEDKVERNARQLEGMKKWGNGFDEDEGEVVDEVREVTGVSMTKEDLEREEREIRELERKKKGLESRVSEMEKDLGGLMR